MSKSAREKRSANGEEGEITVSRTMFNQITEDKEFIKIRPFATIPARVGVKCARTINLGNFESAKVSVMVDMPCYVEEAKETYENILRFVENKLGEQVEKITSSINGKTSVEELL